MSVGFDVIQTIEAVDRSLAEDGAPVRVQEPGNASQIGLDRLTIRSSNC